MNYLNTTINFLQTLVTIGAIFIAYKIGKKQNEINEKLGNLQDVVELHGALLIEQEKDKEGKIIKEKPYICVQNVGTRLIYLERYTFNGKKYLLNGFVLASTYSQTLANYYKIELPTNGENHVFLSIRYRDQDDRVWKSEIVAEAAPGWGWKIIPYQRKKAIK